MSVTTTRRRLVDLWRQINGVRTVFDNIPRQLQAAQLPGVVIYPAEATYDTDVQGDETSVKTRVYRMVLYLSEAAFETEADIQIEADPFFDSVPTLFEAHPQLMLPGAAEPQDVVFNSKLLGDNGFQIGAYPLTAEKQYALVEWRLQVVEINSVEYAD